MAHVVHDAFNERINDVRAGLAPATLMLIASTAMIIARNAIIEHIATIEGGCKTRPYGNGRDDRNAFIEHIAR